MNAIRIEDARKRRSQATGNSARARILFKPLFLIDISEYRRNG